MRVIWIVLCCSRQHVGGCINAYSDLMNILNGADLSNIQIKFLLGNYHMAWTGWVPDLMNTGPPGWQTVH